MSVLPEDDFAPLSENLDLDEIEAAYLRAMEATESLEDLFPAVIPSTIPPSTESPPFTGETRDVDITKSGTAHRDAPETPPDHVPDGHHPANTNGSSIQDQSSLQIPAEEDQRVTPLQVIEALLFVGSEPLPGKKFVDILGGTTTHEQVDLFIEQLNFLYTSQLRPYEIRLVEGGYQLGLKTEFEPVRRKVYGQGPKEVKLNQESLEILAFVAYRQPVTKADLEETEKKNASAVLRQLLRRQLVSLERNESTGTESYRTTKRFLDLFGLTSLADLPQAMDFNFK